MFFTTFWCLQLHYTGLQDSSPEISTWLGEGWFVVVFLLGSCSFLTGRKLVEPFQ